MWGPSIVGFGTYRYTYESGHSGAAPVVGYAIRGRDLDLYVTTDGVAQQDRLARLGKHKMGKSCLYFKKLADLDLDVLEGLVAGSVADVRRGTADDRAHGAAGTTILREVHDDAIE